MKKRIVLTAEEKAHLSKLMIKKLRKIKDLKVLDDAFNCMPRLEKQKAL